MLDLQAEAIASEEAAVATDLNRRIAMGDAAAEIALVARYSRGVRGLLRRRGIPADLADDLHQETFRIVLERLRRKELAQPAGLAGFLHGIVRRLILAERRKAARRQTDVDPEGLEQAVHPALGQLQTLLRAERALLVRRLIGGLSTDRDRQILVRFYLAEEDKESICAGLGLDPQHFHRVIFRARQRFKEQLLQVR
jgi:RNA polymerase sigma-70 factor (ECF subfamily)